MGLMIWNMIPAAWRVGAMIGLATVVIGLAGGAYWYVDHGGYNRAATEWSAKYNDRELALERQRLAELDRQALANDQAKANEVARLAQLRNELTALERQLQEQADEAANDPDADRVGLGADSVLRIDRIGRPQPSATAGPTR